MNKSALPLLLFILAVNICQSQIIIDHRNTDITSLSEAEITDAKQTLHIAYGHTSHGSQVTDGMTGLVTFANNGGKGMTHPTNIFRWNNGGTSGALDLHDGAMGGDVGYYPQWVTNTTNYLGTANPETGMGNTNPDVNVIMWSWCGQAAGYSETDMINKYLAPMSQLEESYPNVKFIYMTCHLNGTGATGNLNLRNEQIRDYCIANKKILYDFADIESYDPDGLVNYMLLNANDNCDYDSDENGSLDKNWATSWQNTHTKDVDWYSVSCQHSQSLNGNQKAYAAWALFVEIAKAIKLESIPVDLEVNDTIVSDGANVCFNAQNDITVAGSLPVTIENNANATFIAGNSILFLPGFNAQQGSNVDAHITTTGSFCDDLPTPIMATEPVVEKSAAEPVDEEDQPEPDIPGAAMKIFPNPNNGQFTLVTKEKEMPEHVSVYNAIGQKIKDFVKITNLQFDINGEKPGVYVVRATWHNKEIFQKFIIR
jgi:hypothetical protein